MFLYIDKGTADRLSLLQNMVYMNQTPQAMYQNVIEKTRGFVFRTSAMGQAIDRRANPSGYPAGADGPGGRGGAGGRGGRGGAASGGRGGRGGGRGGSAGGRSQGQGQYQQQSQQRPQVNGQGPKTDDGAKVNGSAAPAESFEA
jgi:translation initiation factor 3 subunit E